MKKIDLIKIKNVNENVISELGINNFEFLPVISRKKDYRNLDEIKIRVVVLSIIVQISFDLLDSNVAYEYLKEHGLIECLTKEEILFIKGNDTKQRINETWKSECVFCLLWSIGIVENINDPNELADLNSIELKNYPFLNISSNPDLFIKNKEFKLRDKLELVKMLDFYSRLDYICDWYEINDLKCSNINSAIVYERRYALTWLTTQIYWDNVECNSIL